MSSFWCWVGLHADYRAGLALVFVFYDGPFTASASVGVQYMGTCVGTRVAMWVHVINVAICRLRAYSLVGMGLSIILDTCFAQARTSEYHTQTHTHTQVSGLNPDVSKWEVQILKI